MAKTITAPIDSDAYYSYYQKFLDSYKAGSWTVKADQSYNVVITLSVAGMIETEEFTCVTYSISNGFQVFHIDNGTKRMYNFANIIKCEITEVKSEQLKEDWPK